LLEGRSTEDIEAITRIINQAHEESLRKAESEARKRRKSQNP